MKRFGLISGYIGVDRRRDEAGIAPLQKVYLERIRQGGGNYLPISLLLDLYPNAAAAYSTRKLRTSYIGNAIKVRRSTDNAEQDIGFVDGNLDTASLLAFCGVGSGFVTTWYDQSGNSNNAIQIIAINQPKIYDSSIGLTTLGGFPSLDFDGRDDYLNLSNFSTFNNVTVLSVLGDLSFPPSNPRFYDLYDGTNHIQFLVDGSTTYKVKYDLWQAGLNATSFGSITTTHQLNFMLATNGANTLSINNTTISASPSTNVGSAGGVGKIGARADLNGVTFMNGKFQEIVIYQSDQTINKLGIQNNINSYYNIY